MSKREKYLRNRLTRLEGDPVISPRRGRHGKRPNEFCKRFFEIKPRPKESELEKVNYPLGIDTQLHIGRVPEEVEHLKDIPQIRSAKKDLRESWLRDLARRHWKYGGGRPDMEGWKKMCDEETRKRRVLMRQIIDSRKHTD